ncbi:MAG: hypothetical protein A3G39_09425 [Deltaproteobacteria bacterium RIFCSPLOWO2_12_FULL_43_16]|nr:MAG: hypothetical protein A2Z89_05065 [Deltaproteobacteria bacterium GWA2_43_19]OGQ09989.1 MAG: hypothetical protein A3D30_06485 [Deltaproteobacteria bacterium RIFCSPHIGHO2_02_FULL_43_33]OGQ38852.1 MAG: hypothetical protein A3A85_06810 [Deltaproteobacteria bacterium RIFCSPLOWO2_01_FULL_42_9]OGQ58678.1 MAG: hypothetical protein A3G39_09425 [Deltaproteobacteria bacterium RIFCSPLOWO2_12_FULL_43_16]
MLDIIWQSFLVSLVGGLLSLDRTAVLQIMVSRPIITGPIIGYILGDVKTGLLIGGMLELLFVGGLPIGGHIPPHEVMIAVLVTTITIIGQRLLYGIGFDRFPWRFADSDIIFVLGAAILMISPMDAACKKADTSARFFNRRFFNTASAELGNGNIKGVIVNNLKGAGVFFLLNFATLLVLSLAGVGVVYLSFLFLPVAVIMSLPLACASVLIIGLASAYNTSYDNRSLPIFLAAALFVLMIITVGVGRW